MQPKRSYNSGQFSLIASRLDTIINMQHELVLLAQHIEWEELENHFAKKTTTKFALATIYNTVHAFTKAGHLSEVDVRGKKTYFDTNITNHHHFYDNETSELIDIDESEVVIQKIPKAPNGKKIKNVEVFINLKN